MDEMKAADFKITRAEREGVPALVSLWGPSGAGKTYTALLLARGLVGAEGKIGLIDTENRRAKFYAGLVGGWDHLDFQPPFSPERYIEAFGVFDRAGGYGAVIVDSLSHIWEGVGGVLDIATQSKYEGLLKWQRPKMSFKRAVNTLFRAPYHMIFCLRAKDKVRQIGVGKDAQIVSEGLVPIVSQTFVYDMTVDIQLDRLSHAVLTVKCPEDLLPAFPNGKILTQTAGQAIAQWVGSAKAVDAGDEEVRRQARDISHLGTARLREFYKQLGVVGKKGLEPIVAELKMLATEADQQIAEEHQAASRSPLEDPFRNQS